MHTADPLNENWRDALAIGLVNFSVHLAAEFKDLEGAIDKAREAVEVTEQRNPKILRDYLNVLKKSPGKHAAEIHRIEGLLRSPQNAL